ncbi:serum response factor-binding protein 1 isoform X2 [Tiliqua scincoides]|uniref:serum response factor-binding protein 1 isoform X2 n=1 Tax=Tiliqua scincoides TaxID=71010 RepID=UPI003461C643
MAQALNLNNEVVKMRKEVKKVRVLTIRRLTRHIAKLKAKKGSEDAVLKNHKRAQRLLEEIHAMKEVKLDQVTKLALATEISFELVCKKLNCTAADRAIARLAAHPLLKTKIADIKAAVKAFKDARRKPARVTSSEGQKLEEPLTAQPRATQHSSSSVHSKMYKQTENQDKTEVKEKPDTDMGKKLICEKLRIADSEENCHSGDLTVQSVKHDKLFHQSQTEKSSCPKGNKYLDGILSRAVDESDSDASQTEETGTEKEYFDDSTEERFYHQSSSSEESDSSDDFFIGKMKRVKKRGAAGTVDRVKSRPPKKLQGSEYDTMQDTKGSSPGSKAMKLQSVFYSSLSNSKQKSKNRTVRDHLPQNKMGNTASGKKCPQKQLLKGIGKKQDLKRERLEQPLHPSWEASRKRQEQVSQIAAFQGKRITFED